MAKLKLFPVEKIILAPRGECSPAALQQKGIFKKLFLIFAKITRIYKNIEFQASTKNEAADIQNVLNILGCGQNKIHIASDLVPTTERAQLRRTQKTSGKLNLVFLSRISPIKNLDFALQVLSKAQGQIHFDIYGPISNSEDRAYWEKCEKIIKTLPANVMATYCGATSANDVTKILAGYDAFILPTKSENFGHAILEALSVGLPVIISDQTPWLNLRASQVGWDLSLQTPESFLQALNTLVQMNATEHQYLRSCCQRFAEQNLNRLSDPKHYRDFFKVETNR